MLESVFLLLVCVGVVFMILSFRWESLTLSIITLVIWLSLSIGVYQIEIPYQVITSADVVVTGTQHVENLYMYSWFFLALAIIMFLYIISIVFQLYRNRERRIM